MVQSSQPLKTVLVISMCQSIVHVCAALLVEEFLPMMIHQPEEARAASSRSKQQQQQAAGREWEYMCADTHNKQQQHSFVLFSHIELTVIGWMLVTNHRLNQGLEGKHPNVTFPPIPHAFLHFPRSICSVTTTPKEATHYCWSVVHNPDCRSSENREKSPFIMGGGNSKATTNAEDGAPVFLVTYVSHLLTTECETWSCLAQIVRKQMCCI